MAVQQADDDDLGDEIEDEEKENKALKTAKIDVFAKYHKCKSQKVLFLHC